MTKFEALPAIKVVDKVLELIVDLEPGEIQEALSALGTAESTWGLLWGLENIQLSGKDLEFYELKGKVLRFFQQLQKDSRYPVAVVTIAMHRAKKLREATE